MGNQQSNSNDFLTQAKSARQNTERMQKFYNQILGSGIKPCEYKLNDREAQCYLNRYPELKDYFGNDLENAKKHWQRFGCTPTEKRIFVCPTKKCRKTLSDEEARCYLNRYTDLELLYGEDLDKAKADYKWFGCLPPENRIASCEKKMTNYDQTQEQAQNIIKAYNKHRHPYKLNKNKLEVEQGIINGIDGDFEATQLSLDSNRMEFLLYSLGGLGVIIISLKFLK
tara:strand:- start:2099 stop:2776 length:678 start_codon:yes stop_codon:yes gene_type:complete